VPFAVNRGLKGLLIAMLVLVFVAGCRDEGPDIAAMLQENGYYVTNASQQNVVYVGAQAAQGADVNGSRVVIYKFGTIGGRQEGEKAVSRIITAGSGFWPMNVLTTTEAYFGKDRYLVVYGEHPDRDRIRQLLDLRID